MAATAARYIRMRRTRRRIQDPQKGRKTLCRSSKYDDTCIEAIIPIGLRYALTCESCIQPSIQPNYLHELIRPSPHARACSLTDYQVSGIAGSYAAAFKRGSLSACNRPLHAGLFMLSNTSHPQSCARNHRSAYPQPTGPCHLGR
jgi:hypothetical protein